MRNNIFIGIVFGFFLGVLAGWMTSSMAMAPKGIMTQRPMISSRELELKLAMRKLWEDHVSWTRMYIMSATTNGADADLIAQRLLQNQDDIGNAIKPYYGDDAGNRLSVLLREHIAVAVEIINAAKKSDAKAQAEAEQKWSRNANDIAQFLADANPNWTKEEMSQMLENHLTLTKEEVVGRLTKNYSADISAYDRIHDQAMEMADALADGIIKQFPDKF